MYKTTDTRKETDSHSKQIYDAALNAAKGDALKAASAHAEALHKNFPSPGSEALCALIREALCERNATRKPVGAR